MSFTNRAALEARFGTAEMSQLTDRSGGAVVDDSVLAGAIAAADAIIVPYLHAYDLAAVQASPDPILGEIALHLARAALYVAGKPEEVAASEKNALGMLDRISNGAMRLSVGSPAAAVDLGSVAYDAPDRVFTEAAMERY